MPLGEPSSREVEKLQAWTVKPLSCWDTAAGKDLVKTQGQRRTGAHLSCSDGPFIPSTCHLLDKRERPFETIVCLLSVQERKD